MGVHPGASTTRHRQRVTQPPTERPAMRWWRRIPIISEEVDPGLIRPASHPVTARRRPHRVLFCRNKPNIAPLTTLAADRPTVC